MLKQGSDFLFEITEVEITRIDCNLGCVFFHIENGILCVLIRIALIYLHIKENQKDFLILPPDLAL